jgi:Family of unknown function (DUF5317)
MLLLATILLIGGLLGVGLGGDPRNLADVQIRGWWLIPAALVVQLLPLPQGDAGFLRVLPLSVLLLSYVVLVVAAVVNWRLRGFPLILLGLALNFTVIGVNQGMPVDRAALLRTENPDLLEGLPVERGGKHHLADDGDILLPLADVIAFREPFGIVVSAGDLFIDVGGAIFLGTAILGRSERPSRRPSSRPPSAPPEGMWGTPRSRWSPGQVRSRS